MSICVCRLVLAALVIVFAWLNVPWSSIALTIIGILLVILALFRNFCCLARKQKQA
jgi:hypothetical protein